MRVYNLTDVPTPALQATGMVGVSISVGGVTIEPGGSAEVAKLSATDQRLVSVGAIADHEPEKYKRLKAFKKPKTDTPAPKPEPKKVRSRTRSRLRRSRSSRTRLLSLRAV